MTAWQVLVVDDDARFRQGVCTLLEFYGVSHPPGLHLVAEAGSAAEALALTHEHQPQLILLDLELGDGTGIEVLLQLRAQGFSGKILVLSGHQEDDWIFQAMQAGATGYVFKSRVSTQLPEAISTVMQSEIYLPPEVASGFFRLFQAHAAGQQQAQQALHLTDREREVLHWLAQGASNEEIAKHLYVTVATVKAHLTSIFEKLKVNSRTQAIVAALKLGLVQAS